MSQSGRQTRINLLGVVLVLSCASAPPPTPQAIPQFDPSKFVICRSHPGVSEYSYAMSVLANEQVLDLVTPPIEAIASLSVRLDDQGRVDSVETVTADPPEFGAVAAAAVELASPYPAPPEGLERCVRGKSLRFRVEAHVEAQCNDIELSTQYVLSVRNRIDAVIDSPEYMAQPGHGYAFLRLLFGAEGQIEMSRISKAPSRDLERKIERALEAAKPFGRPPLWDQCFANQPITLKIEALTTDR